MLLNDVHLEEANTVISPSVKNLHWSDFGKMDLLINEGEKAAVLKIMEIKAKTRLPDGCG